MVFPNREAYFGDYGGCFVPETLYQALKELYESYTFFKKDQTFVTKMKSLLNDYVGRPSPLYFSEKCSRRVGCRVYLKREDLNHTGAHKINNTLGQALLAKMMGKKRIIAETGAGQHGVATATACALLDMDCVIYMGNKDRERQQLNVFRMQSLGARVVGVASGSQTLKDATNEAMRDWAVSVKNTHYIIGSVVGPHPFPTIVRNFQSVIGREVKKQIVKKEGRLPDYLMACVGGGSNAMGLFYPFVKEKSVRFIGVEAQGRGDILGEHCATLTRGKPGIFHGSRSYLLQDECGQVLKTHSVSAGLDYPGVGPEHSFYLDSQRAEYVSVSDQSALKAFQLFSQMEGIVPALETAHALGYLLENPDRFGSKDIVVVNLSGRGDKDVTEFQKKYSKSS